MKQLYERSFQDMSYTNESVWRVYNKTVKIRVGFADYQLSQATVLTQNGDWAFLEKLHGASATTDLYHKYDEADKTVPPAEIIAEIMAAFQKDRDELLRLCGLLLEGTALE